MDVSNLVMIGSVVAAFFGVVMGLYAVAVHLGREISIHNLTVEAHTLRRDYTQRLAELRGEYESESEEVNFEYVDEGAPDGPSEAIELGEDAGTPSKQAA